MDGFVAVRLSTGGFAAAHRCAYARRGQAGLLGLLLSLGFLVLLLVCGTLDALPQTEFRALWVLRNTLVSRRSIDRMVLQAREAGFNILLVQVRGRGDALYDSSIEPRSELLQDDGFDPLAYVIDEAHGNGLEVHAWLNAFFVWAAPQMPTDERHVVLAHPDWIAVRSDGKSLLHLSRREIETMGIQGVFLSPGNPEVRRHLRAVVRELVERYALDGIHLDYVRYANMDIGYDVVTRTQFMRDYAVDPLEMVNNREMMKELFGDKGVLDVQALWAEWRAGDVDDLIESIHVEMKTLDPNVKLSAAVVADVHSAVAKYAQNWPSWLERGILDFAVPMCYSASTKSVKNQAVAIKKLVGKGRFYPGIAMYNQSSGRVVEKVRVLRTMGIQGFSMFCYDPDHSRRHIFTGLSRTVFSAPATAWSD